MLGRAGVSVIFDWYFSPTSQFFVASKQIQCFVLFFGFKYPTALLNLFFSSKNVGLNFQRFLMLTSIVSVNKDSFISFQFVCLYIFSSLSALIELPVQC